MITVQFKTGGVLSRQGDPSDYVLRVCAGEIEVLRKVGSDSILLGHVREGEWLGEMGGHRKPHPQRNGTCRYR
jgi:CRP-like cAMP-binding protein